MDVDLIIQDAFKQVKRDKERVDNIEQALHQNIELAEQAAKLFLKHLYELNIIRLNISALNQDLFIQADDLATAATVMLDTPTNRALRLAMMLSEYSTEELAQAIDYLKEDKRLELKELL